MGGESAPEDKKTIVRKRVIKDLGSHEILVGSDLATLQGIAEGDSLTCWGNRFPWWPFCLKRAPWTTRASSATCIRSSVSRAKAKSSIASKVTILKY